METTSDFGCFDVSPFVAIPVVTVAEAVKLPAGCERLGLGLGLLMYHVFM